MVDSAGREEWRTNWPVVLVTMLGFAISLIHIYSLGVMIDPLEKEFGWSRTQITSGLLIVSLVVSPLAPVMGLAIDRFGPRHIAMVGVAAYCMGIASLSLAQDDIWTWWVLWLFVAFGNLFVINTVWVTAITGLFDASRGLAIAVALSAAGSISFAGPMLTNYLVDSVGWRMTFLVWGTVPALIALPMLFFFFSSPKDKVRVAPAADGHTRRHARIGFSSFKDVTSPTFLKLASASLIMSVMTVGLLVNLVPIITYLGMARGRAAAVAGLVSLTQVAGRLIGGVLLDRFDARMVGVLTVLIPIFSVLLLLYSGTSIVLVAVAVLLLGLAAGAEIDVIAYLAGRFFGLQNFGALFGIISGLLTLGVGLGPMAGSFIYDVTGSYRLVLWVVIPMCVFSALLLYSLGPCPKGRARVAPAFAH